MGKVDVLGIPGNPDCDSADDRSPIFWCPLCPGPVYTPYIIHYIKFHPDFQKV